MKFKVPTQAALGGLNLLILLVSLLTFSPVNAASFSVSPIRVDLSAKESIAALKIKNPSANDVSIHAEIYQWTQNNAQDQLTNTSDLLVTPPIFTIPADGVQIIRVGLKTGPDSNMEGSYRLHLTQIPSPKTETTQGLSIATRISLPIFVSPVDTGAQFDLRWIVQLSDDKKILLNAVNKGNGHAKITEIKLNKVGENALSKSVHNYILPGSLQVWSLPSEAHSFAKDDELELNAKVNNEWLRILISVQ